MNGSLSHQQSEELRVLKLEDEASRVPQLEAELAHVRGQLKQAIKRYDTLDIHVRLAMEFINNQDRLEGEAEEAYS